MTLGEKIKKLRMDNNLSQEQLAEKLSVSRQAITKWENDGGIPDINNLKNISRLFNVSIDSLLDYNSGSFNNVLKEEINLEEYEKTGKCRSKYDAVVKSKYPNAKIIYPLIRSKRLNKMEWIIDFITEPGILNVVDSLNDLDAYYLVENSNNQLLVRVSKKYIEVSMLEERFEGKKAIINGNVFKKFTYTL